MNIKFNWGTGIFISIVLFVTFFVTLIIYSFSHDINLVSEDYFPEEISYEKTLQKIKNTQTLDKKITHETTDDELIIKFPKGYLFKDIEGTIHFFYVTSFREDKKFTLEPDNSGKQVFKKKDFKQGRYTLKIDWKYKEKGYYQEIKIHI